MVWLGASLATAGGAPEQWSKESGLTEPKTIEKVEPVYPEEARKERVQGAVVLEATVGTDGGVVDLKADRGPGRPAHRRGARGGRQWRSSRPATPRARRWRCASP